MIGAAVFGALALILGAVTLYGRGAWLKALAYTSLVCAVAILWWASLGHPKPVWLGVPRGTIAAYVLDEPRAIYLWVVPVGATEPVAVALPWSVTRASQLGQAEEQAKRNGGQLRMRPGHGANGIEDRGAPMFYAQPRAPLPPKVSR